MAHMRRENQKATAPILMTAERLSKVNGLMGKNMDPVFGEDLKEIPILASGSKVKHSGTESTLGSTETDMRANFRIVLNMERGFRSLQMVTLTKDYILTENLKAMGNIIGPLEVSSKETSRTG